RGNEREADIVIAQAVGRPLLDEVVVDPLPVELYAVGALEILDEVLAVAAHDGAVSAGDVGVLDREIGVLRTAPDDELVLIDLVDLPLEVQVQRSCRGLSRGLRDVIAAPRRRKPAAGGARQAGRRTRRRSGRRSTPDRSRRDASW